MPAYSQVEGEQTVPGNPAFSLLSIARTIWKRKVPIAAAWIVFAGAAIMVVRMLPAVYLAETVVLIDSQKIPEKFVSATVATDLEDRIAAIREMLLSSGELKKVIDDFGLYREARKSHFEEEILDMMRRDISINLNPAGMGTSSKGDKRTAAFRIGYQGSDPHLVMRVANRLTDLYVEQNLKTRESQAAGTSSFLDTQLHEAKKRLDELEAKVSEYKLQHNGELPQQEQSLSSTLSRLQTELEANRDAINRAHQTKVILESTISATEASIAAQTRTWEQSVRGQDVPVPYIPGQPAAAQTVRPSDALEDQLAQARAHLTENHPEVIRLRKALENERRAEAQRQAARIETAAASANPASGSSPNRQASSLSEPPEITRAREQLVGLMAQVKGADTEMENRKTEQQRILRDLDLYQRRIEHLPVREQEMAQITRDYEMSKENYKSLLDKKMAAEMALDMERRQQSERFTVLDRARVPEKPVKPNRPLLYALGSGLGLALALLVGFTAELRKDVVLGEWELPEGTPVLARLPRIEVPAGPGSDENRGGRLARGRMPADVPLNG